MKRILSIFLAATLGIGLASCRATGPADPAADSDPAARKEVERTLIDLLGAAGRKEFDRVESMHLYGPKFTRWDGKSPGRLDAEMTRRTEREGIEALDAFRASAEDLKVDVFGPTAVTTFVMAYEVVAKGTTTQAKTRATLVWVKVGSGWKIVHEHFSPFPPKP